MPTRVKWANTPNSCHINKTEIDPLLNSDIQFQMEHLTSTPHNLKLSNDVCALLNKLEVSQLRVVSGQI